MVQGFNKRPEAFQRLLARNGLVAKYFNALSNLTPQPSYMIAHKRRALWRKQQL